MIRKSNLLWPILVGVYPSTSLVVINSRGCIIFTTLYLDWYNKLETLRFCSFPHIFFVHCKCIESQI